MDPISTDSYRYINGMPGLSTVRYAVEAPFCRHSYKPQGPEAFSPAFTLPLPRAIHLRMESSALIARVSGNFYNILQQYRFIKYEYFSCIDKYFFLHNYLQKHAPHCMLYDYMYTRIRARRFFVFNTGRFIYGIQI